MVPPIFFWKTRSCGVECIPCRSAAGEAARTIEKDRVKILFFAMNIISDEYKLGRISAYSPVGKMIIRIRL